MTCEKFTGKNVNASEIFMDSVGCKICLCIKLQLPQNPPTFL